VCFVVIVSEMWLCTCRAGRDVACLVGVWSVVFYYVFSVVVTLGDDCCCDM